MDKEIRLMAAEIVVESEMSKAAKLQMLRFIKEQATDSQVKSLMMDGKIVHLDEQAEQIVNERFKIHYLNEKMSKQEMGDHMKLVAKKCKSQNKDRKKYMECFKKESKKLFSNK